MRLHHTSDVCAVHVQRHTYRIPSHVPSVCVGLRELGLQPTDDQHMLLRVVALLAALSPPCVDAWFGSMTAVDVSPSPEQIATNAVFLGGYGALGFRDGLTLGFARGVHDPIQARALYLEDDHGQAFVTLVLDVVGVGNVIRDEIRSAASLATELPMERILVASTHTHAGPDLQGMWGGIETSYRSTVVQGAVAAISRAVATKTRVTLSVGSIETGDTLGRNRRGWDYVLNTTSVLLLRSTETATVVGAFASFPAHTTILGRSNMQASGDFAGYVCRAVEARLQAPAMWINGAVGDVSVVGHGGEGFDRLARYGEVAAEQIVAAFLLHERPIPSDGRLDFEAVAYTQEITNLAFVAALALGVLDDYYETVPGSLATIQTIAARVRIGEELEIVTSPGESLTRNGKEHATLVALGATIMHSSGFLSTHANCLTLCAVLHWYRVIQRNQLLMQ